MHLKVLPATDQDIPACMVCQFAAFHDEPYNDILFPGGNNAATRQSAAERTIAQWHGTPEQHIMKCVDSDTDEILGFGIFNLYDKERAEEEWNKPLTVTWCEGEAAERVGGVLGCTVALRNKLWEGRKHYLCAVLAVRPDYQRKGVGTALVNWWIAEADKVGVPAYLEATVYGRPLYRKLGLREIDSELLIIKAAVWGGDRDLVYVPMVRPVGSSRLDS